ncbi:glycosyltransferase family 9 protein [Tardiphaga sp.]|uniref:glycosyltransferase family 9 protein n=1 Tax=Tardiphaga sp. TaxID=1926292 RepID=UPI0037D9E48B
MTERRTESKWATAMRRSEFERAWQISDEILRVPPVPLQPKHHGPRHQQRIWRGEPLAGRRVLVRCYHGLGDTIQFLRFLPHLRRLAGQVILWVQPELLSLIGRVDVVDIALPLHDGMPNIDYDVDIEIMELAHALRADAAMIEGCVPYLKAGRRDVIVSPPTRRRVGLVWEVGNWDKHRSVPYHLLGKLLQDTGVELYSLQQGTGRGDAGRIPAIDIAVPDITTLADLIMQLDLVITVDTMVAHLAGALGAPVWTMLHADCDWRWPLNDSRTIWYPTMRLFHQPRAGDWTLVVSHVAKALKDEAWNRTRGRRQRATL